MIPKTLHNFRAIGLCKVRKIFKNIFMSHGLLFIVLIRVPHLDFFFFFFFLKK
jgi:hypothetical protein